MGSKASGGGYHWFPQGTGPGIGVLLQVPRGRGGEAGPDTLSL
jgi:hypothetical protein